MCDDCVVISWPWIVTLEVDKVARGRVPTNQITVLNVQHVHFRGDRLSRWWLRRNTLGVFNVLRLENGSKPPRCPADADPAQPLITPPTGQSLKDLEREGARLYGRHTTP